MTNDGEPLRFERRGSALWCTIDRPEKRNAMTGAMYARLETALKDADRDQDVRVVVLTGAGDQAFSSGSDVNERIGSLTASSWDEQDRDPFARFFSRISKPIIAAVNGYCIGGGLEMMLGTDIRIAVEDAWFQLPEVGIGIVPAGGAHVRLPKQIPYAIAMEMLMTGGRVSARRAYEVGLINAVVPAGGLVAAVDRMAERIASNGPLAVRTSKAIVVAAQDNERGFQLDHLMSGRVFASEDAAEGRASFQEKRSPVFRGR